MADVDFSQLIDYKKFDDLRLTAFNRLKAISTNKITNLNVGGVYRTLIELAMQGVADLYDLLLMVTPKGYLEYATGTWLRLKAAELGIEPKEESVAVGNVIFGRKDTSGNVVIPSGTIVKTNTTASGTELKYYTTADAVLKDGIGELAVSVTAESAGADYNVGAGTIINLGTNVSGIDYVTNTSDWLTSEGADEESDAELLARLEIRWSEVSLGQPAEAYRSWALAVTGVSDAYIVDNFPRGAGTVDVVILSTSGTPTDTLINAVQEVMNEKRAICADVLVKAPAETAIDVTLMIYLDPDSTLDINVVQSAALEYTNAYFGNGTVDGVDRLAIGKDYLKLSHASMIKAIYPDDIMNVVISNPTADVSIAAGTVAVAGTINITVERASEE
jgi:uncharacterized phage protein gp47/JayE